MKIFVRSKNESVVINGEITITIVEILDDEVVLAVDAPAWVAVCEEETLEATEMTRSFSR